MIQPIAGRDAWSAWGISAGDFSAPWTYFTSVFVHASLAHISGNSTFMLLLGVIIGLEGVKRWVGVFVGSAVTAGLFVSALTPSGVTVGASGVVFGYFGYILTAALVERTLWVKVLRIVVAIALLISYSATIIIGFLPASGVSWQAHVGGFVGGVIVAIIAERGVEPRKRAQSP